MSSAIKLIVDNDGSRRLMGPTPAVVDGDVVRHRAAGDVPTLGSTVEEARSAVAGRVGRIMAVLPESGHVHVIGDGALAAALRTALGSRSASADANLAAVVDVTGAEDSIVDALHRLTAGAVLVLAAWSPHPSLTVDPYTDLHRPGVLVRTPAAAGDASIVINLPDPVSATFEALPTSGEWFLLGAS